MQRNQKVIHVFHGSSVEARSQFFAEAVWNDSFDAVGIGKASLFFGTGGMIDGNQAVFKTSSDPSAPLFSLRRKDDFMISNSIFHLMVLAGTEPRKAYPFYTYDLLRNARAGIRQPAGRLPHAGKGILKVHFNTNIRLDVNLYMGFTAYASVAEPVDYESLLSIYRREIDRLFRNGADQGRSIRYGQTILASSGYDSLVNAVVCAGLGSKWFVSVVDSHSSTPNVDSGGGPLAWLGLQVREVDRNVHLAHDKCVDAEFALLAISNHPFLSGCEESLRGRLLVSGSLGDAVWDPELSMKLQEWQDWRKIYMPGVASIEHRLRVGYIDVYPQTMFAIYGARLTRISMSEEMLPYHIAGGYNRPIPRRIIEEAGIPRGAFAFRKLATAFKYFTHPDNLHADARTSYHLFVECTLPKGWRRWMSMSLYYCESWLYRKIFRRYQQQRNDDPDRFRLVALDGTRVNVPWRQSFLLQWSFEALNGRYAEAAEAQKLYSSSTQHTSS